MKKIKKYPVITENGDVYSVTLKGDNSSFSGGVEVTIKQERKGIYGIVYYSTVETYTYFDIHTEIDIISKYGSIRNLVNHSVGYLVNTLRVEKEDKKRVKESLKELEEWDGIVYERGNDYD